MRALGPDRAGLPDGARRTGEEVRHRELGDPGHLRFTSRSGSEDSCSARIGLAWSGSRAVSDPSRTIVDVLDDPSLGGGIRNVADVLREYFQGEHRDDELLVEYGGPTRQPSRVQAAGLPPRILGVDAAGSRRGVPRAT